MDTLLLKYFISRAGHTIKSLSSVLGLNVATLSQKINNKRPTSTEEAKAIIETLHLEKEEAWTVFFYPKMYGNAQRKGEEHEPTS